MQTGTVSEFAPQDGLGWITLDDGGRVRFGLTACRAGIPPIGTRVRILGTAPGFRGVLKATGIELLDPPVAAPRPLPAPARARKYLAVLDALGITLEPPLRVIVQAADQSDALFNDLEQLAFQLQPMRAEELDCHDPRFFVVAMDGGGNAYGLYHLEDRATLPWVFWDHEIDRITHVADDTASFFATLLGAAHAQRARDAAQRVRAALEALGIVLPALSGPARLEGVPAEWITAPAQ